MIALTLQGIQSNYDIVPNVFPDISATWTQYGILIVLSLLALNCQNKVDPFSTPPNGYIFESTQYAGLFCKHWIKDRAEICLKDIDDKHTYYNFRNEFIPDLFQTRLAIGKTLILELEIRSHNIVPETDKATELSDDIQFWTEDYDDVEGLFPGWSRPMVKYFTHYNEIRHIGIYFDRKHTRQVQSLVDVKDLDSDI